MIHRIKSPVKFAEKLTKITSTIKGLVQLSYRHNIKNKLRDSDITDKLYQIIGEERLTKFLINIYDQDLEWEVLSERLHSWKKILTTKKHNQ